MSILLIKIYCLRCFIPTSTRADLWWIKANACLYRAVFDNLPIYLPDFLHSNCEKLKVNKRHSLHSLDEFCVASIQCNTVYCWLGIIVLGHDDLIECVHLTALDNIQIITTSIPVHWIPQHMYISGSTPNSRSSEIIRWNRNIYCWKMFCLSPTPRTEIIIAYKDASYYNETKRYRWADYVPEICIWVTRGDGCTCVDNNSKDSAGRYCQRGSSSFHRKKRRILCIWYDKRHTHAWWRHQMETFFAWLAFVRGIHRSPMNSPAQRPVTRSFDIFFDLRLNKRLSKQSWGWWFETISCPLWRQCNANETSLHLFVTNVST